MTNKPKLKSFLLRTIVKTSNIILTIRSVVLVTLLIAMTFIIPIVQDYNSTNYPKYKIIKCYTYEVKLGDTLSEIAERFKPEYMKLSNYIAEIQFTNGIGTEISEGDKLLIPVEKLK